MRHFCNWSCTSKINGLRISYRSAMKNGSLYIHNIYKQTCKYQSLWRVNLINNFLQWLLKPFGGREIILHDSVICITSIGVISSRIWKTIIPFPLSLHVQTLIIFTPSILCQWQLKFCSNFQLFYLVLQSGSLITQRQKPWTLPL